MDDKPTTTITNMSYDHGTRFVSFTVTVTPQGIEPRWPIIDRMEPNAIPPAGWMEARFREAVAEMQTELDAALAQAEALKEIVRRQAEREVELMARVVGLKEAAGHLTQPRLIVTSALTPKPLVPTKPPLPRVATRTQVQPIGLRVLG